MKKKNILITIIGMSLVVILGFQIYTSYCNNVYKMDNGVHIYFEKSDKLPLVEIFASVKTGYRYEALEEPEGVSEVVADMMKRGTQSQTFLNIAQELDQLATPLYILTSDESTSFRLKVLSSDVQKAVKLLYSILATPVFLEKEFSKYKEETMARIESGIQSRPEKVISLLGKKIFYRGTPYARQSFTRNSLKKIKKKHLIKFYKKHYTPENTSLVVSGKGLVLSDFSVFKKWKNQKISPDIVLPSIKVVLQKQVIFVTSPNLKQSYIRYQYLGLPYCHKDRLAWTVANFRLGGSTFHSILGQDIRKKRGLTYGIASFLERKKDSGSFVVSTSTKHANLIEMINLIENHVDNFKNYKMTDEDVAISKNMIRSSLVSLNSLIHSKAKAKFNSLMMGCKDYFETLLYRLENITQKTIQTAQKRFTKDADSMILIYGHPSLEQKIKKWAQDKERVFKIIQLDDFI